MATTTIRGIDDNTLKAIKEKAKQEGVSANTAMVKLIKEGLGITKRPRTVIHTDLDHLAGTWNKKDSAEFQKRIEDFEKIDKDLWK